MITVEGVVEDIIYANETNGYTVCEIRTSDDNVVAVGIMPFLCVGETIKITGKWYAHAEYGEQLKVETFEKTIPRSSEEIKYYLSSGIIKGVGEATATKIIKKFGEATLDVILERPWELTAVKGINDEKAQKICDALRERTYISKIVEFFNNYGIDTALSGKIYNMYRDRTIDIVKENPYLLTDENFRVGFKTADIIAKNIGIDKTSPFRVSSGIIFVLSEASRNGHVYLPWDNFEKQCMKILSIDNALIEDVVISLTMNGQVFVEKRDGQKNIYLGYLHEAEKIIAERINGLSTRLPADLSDFEQKIEKVQKEMNIELTKLQKDSIKEALLNGLMIITGGPGTGKTTIVKCIVRLLKNEGLKVELTAPTGKAAKRMTESAGCEARTIHRLLEISYNGNDDKPYFCKNEKNQLEADLIIVDEMSMVDTLMMSILLNAIRFGTRLLLVGDVDQLSSVGAGNVLKDLIECNKIPIIKLNEIFRQAKESMIVVNAHSINKGEAPILNKKDSDFYFINCNNQEEIVSTIVDLCARRLPNKYGYDPLKHIQVLTPTRKGQTGVLNLNIEIQKLLNPHIKTKKERNFGFFTFREKDKIMHIKNNYNIEWFLNDNNKECGTGIFNGETGVINSIDLEDQHVEVLFDDGKKTYYEFSNMDQLDPCYAITIHKSQGSEFPVIIIPLYPGPSILMNRNLIYTGITRAKELVILVGRYDVLEMMIKNERQEERYSGLLNKLKLEKL